ncbi:hypothetical protein GCM10023144_41320 [Pigmentiphaga soli]|uniref:Acyl-CoA thioesterase-like N-terminal HotDog domain-containing protein n=2 Tax=Pigmentiphaga soli TaxID=1007095 RepID=A0ABP8HMN9_9BURK
MLPADSPLLPSSPVLRRMLAGIARNREPGFHFPGNYAGLSFDRVASGDSLTSAPVMPFDADADGRLDGFIFAMLADLALATCVRAEVVTEVRLATVNMHLQLFDVPHGDRLEAHSAFESYVPGAAGRQAVSRTTIRGAGGEVAALGTASFMVLDLPPGRRVPPMRPLPAGEPALLPDPLALAEDEAAIYRRAQAALKISDGAGFIHRFWGHRVRRNASGASGTLMATPHVGNRMGHVQGGIQVGFAEATARAALEGHWMPTSISACFLRPGEPPAVRAEARIAHRGRTTAVVRVRLFNHDRKQVLDAQFAYAARKGA